MNSKLFISFITSILVFFLNTICYAISHENPLIIVTGNNGTILTSPDGIHWTPQSSGVQTAVTTIAHGTNTYAALAINYENRTALTSPDGINWTKQDHDTSFFPWYGMTWDESKKQFLALDESWGDVYTSPNGLDWTARYRGYPDTFGSIAISNDSKKIYTAVGGVIGSNYCKGTVVTSADSITWNKVNQDFPCFMSVTWGNNQFVASGQKGGYDENFEAGFLTSPDAETWTWRSIPTGQKKYINSVVWANNQYVAVGNDEETNVAIAFTSPDGVNWTNHAIDTKNYLFKVAFVNNMFVAVGASGTIVTSQDGINWTVQNSGTNEILRDVG